jgi:hypothetical protein
MRDGTQCHLPIDPHDHYIQHSYAQECSGPSTVSRRVVGREINGRRMQKRRYITNYIVLSSLNLIKRGIASPNIHEAQPFARWVTLSLSV